MEPREEQVTRQVDDPLTLSYHGWQVHSPVVFHNTQFIKMF